MISQSKQMLRLVLMAAAATAAPAGAADGDDSFNAVLEQYQHRAPAEEWQNAWMSWGTGVYAMQSADEILTATLRIYTRDVLDRGYWINAWVGDAPGYSWGNPLFAVAPGSGVSSRVAARAFDDLPFGAPRAERFEAVLAAWWR